MANSSIIFGALLAILGVWGYIAAPADHRSLTAFIPTVVGVVLIVLGAVASLGEAARKHAMHAAAAVGVLGFLLAAGRLLYELIAGKDVTGPGGLSQLTMAVLCGAFVALCVKSFLDARRRRKADAQAPNAAAR